MFTVKWSASASADLAGWILTHGTRADEIDDAAEIIHEQLLLDPIGNGQHVAEGLWRIESGPLSIIYSVDASTVTVESVHWLG